MPSHSWQKCPAWTHPCCQPSIAVNKIQRVQAVQLNAPSTQIMFQPRWSQRSIHTTMREEVDEVMVEAGFVFPRKAIQSTGSSHQRRVTFVDHARESPTGLMVIAFR